MDKAQRTLLDFGFQGRAISITRPVFASLADPDQRMAPLPQIDHHFVQGFNKRAEEQSDPSRQYLDKGERR